MHHYENIPERQIGIKCASIIRPYTCQLFGLNNNKIIPFACTTLCKHNSQFYLLSNSHVFNKKKFSELYFLDMEFNLIMIEGDTFFSESEIRNHNDTYDIAVMRIPVSLAAEFERNAYDFLELETLLTKIDLVKESVVMIAAYPASKTEINFQIKELKFNPTIVRTIPSVKDHFKLGFPKDFHHTVKYPRRSFIETSTRKRTIAPNPYGMSGSGLWLLVGESDLNHYPKLIGILTEYDENRSLIFATKIDIYLSVIKQLFDNTVPFSGAKVEIL